MGIYKGRGQPDQEGGTGTYQCWMCNEGHDSPADFLWHINAHKLEMTNPQTPVVAGRRALEAAHIVSR